MVIKKAVEVSAEASCYSENDSSSECTIRNACQQRTQRDVVIIKYEFIFL